LAWSEGPEPETGCNSEVVTRLLNRTYFTQIGRSTEIVEKKKPIGPLEMNRPRQTDHFGYSGDGTSKN